MRMWSIDPKLLCRKHLLGEHVEMHMFAGSIRKRIQIRGYIKKGLVETGNIRKRHDELAREMEERGYAHNSPLPDFSCEPEGHVDVEENLEELKSRCLDCRKGIERYAMKK